VRMKQRAFARAMKIVLVGVVFVLSAHMLAGKPAQHVPRSIVSDWTQHYLRYPDSQDESVIAQYRKDPRWEQNWYLRHREAWWPDYHPEPSLPDGDSEREWRREHHREPGLPGEERHRDWSVALGASPSSTVINFSFTLGANTAYGSVNVTDRGGGVWLATSGSLTVTGGADVGTWTLYPGGPGVTTSPLGSFNYDDVITPANTRRSILMDFYSELARRNSTSGATALTITPFTILPPPAFTARNLRGQVTSTSNPRLAAAKARRPNIRLTLRGHPAAPPTSWR